MPIYQYKAIDRTGQPVQAQIEAESEQAARDLLTGKGQFVSEISSAATKAKPTLTQVIAKSSNFSFGDRERAEFIRQFATALQAKLPLVTALRVVGQENQIPKVKRLVGELTGHINSGKSLSYAFSQYPRIFDDLHVSMIEAGQAVGILDQSMTQLAQLSEQEVETRSDIVSAALYPAFVLCLGLISVAIVVTWILPEILDTLAIDLAILPWPTRAILAVSAFLQDWWWAVFTGILTAYFAHKQWIKTSMGRLFWDRLVLRIPVMGDVNRKWAVARFARTLGTLSRGGITILDALKIVRNSLGNEVLACEIDTLTRKVRTGSSLATSLRKTGQFPPLLVQIVSVGEETGRLADLLLNASVAFERETQVAIKRFMAIFPALLILLLTMIVGFIVAATILPIVQIETAIPGL